jgi:hypothetical protein
MTGWTTVEMSRQLGLNRTSIVNFLALQKLSQRTISVAQKAKIPTEMVARISLITKKMEPEKAEAVEEAFVGGVESGKIFNRPTANKFLLATKRATVDQLRKYGSKKKYATDDLLKENSAEHASVERNLVINTTSSRSAAKRLTQMLTDNQKLLVDQHLVELLASTSIAYNRLLKTIGSRVVAPEKK